MLTNDNSLFGNCFLEGLSIKLIAAAVLGRRRNFSALGLPKEVMHERLQSTDFFQVDKQPICCSISILRLILMLINYTKLVRVFLPSIRITSGLKRPGLMLLMFAKSERLPMNYHLAQLNIARFRLPREHPDNSDFIGNLDRVNAIAENQEGFLWRFTGEGNNTLDVNAFDDPNIASNMSLWESLETLGAFVYRNEEHREIMRRRNEWFDKIAFFLVLWWVEEGHIPTLEEAKEKHEHLVAQGSTKKAFTFKNPFPSPNRDKVSPILDECA